MPKQAKRGRPCIDDTNGPTPVILNAKVRPETKRALAEMARTQFNTNTSYLLRALVLAYLHSPEVRASVDLYLAEKFCK